MEKQQRFSIVSIIASSLAVWLFIVTQVQPNKNDVFTLAIFFLTLVIWLGSLLTVSFYKIRVKQSNREIIYAHVKPSLRQGFLISSSVALLLFLQFLHVTTLWDSGLVLLVFLMFEFALRDTSILG